MVVIALLLFGAAAWLFTRLDQEFLPEEDKGRLLIFVLTPEGSTSEYTDRMLRRLEAMLLVADKDTTLVITGNGDVLEPNQGIGAIGSGGNYAQAAAIALFENTELSPVDIVKKSLTIAGEMCIYTNLSHTIETLE